MKRLKATGRTLGVLVSAAATTAALVTAGAAGPAAASPDAATQRVAPTLSITGTITINGCALGPRELVLQAQTLGIGALTGRDGGRVSSKSSEPDQRKNRFAQISRTDDPHVLTFRIDDLERGLYHLAFRRVSDLLGVDPGICGKVFWRGPFQGLVVPGGPPVSIEGASARTTIEVQRPEDQQWYGADDVDFADTGAAVRKFRWRTSLPGVDAGELQISTDPFEIVSEEGSSCAEPEETVVWREEVPAEAGGYEEVELNLGSLLDPPPFPEYTGPPLSERLLLGAPLYARVVPLVEGQPQCDAREQGVPGWVLISKVVKETRDYEAEPVKLQLGENHQYRPPYFGYDPQNNIIHPDRNETAVLVVKDHVSPPKSWCTLVGKPWTDAVSSDPIGYSLVCNGIVPPGKLLRGGIDWYYFWPGTSAWYEDIAASFGNLVTGFVDAIGFLVDQASKLYESVKGAIKKIAFKVVLNVPGVGQLCDAYPDECKQAISTALETGMVAAGMPPSIPNWEQVKGDAVGYLSAELASQTGAPQVLTDYAVQVTANAIQEMTEDKGSGSGGLDWVEPYYGYDPAVLFTAVRKTGDNLPPNLFLIRNGSQLFEGDTHGLPTTFSGNLRVPMVLRSNIKGINAPTAQSCNFTPCTNHVKTVHFIWAFWNQRFRTSTCVPFTETSWKLDPFSSPYVYPAPGNLQLKFQQTLNPHQPRTWTAPFTGPAC